VTATIRYAILGCGMMGHEHIHNLALVPGAQVVAIAEPDAEMRASALQLVQNSDAAPEAPPKGFTNLDDLLAWGHMDALVIASPNHCHAQQLLKVLAKTQLPVLVEKPIVTRPEDMELIANAAKSHPAPIWVAMEYRYMPPIQHFRQHLEDKTIGDLKNLTIREHRFPFLQKVGHWNRFNRNTGGTLVEKCCHFFDLMRLLTQGEATRVFASAGQDVNHLEERYDGETPDILDNAYVTVEFNNGKRALLELNMFAEGSQFQEELSAVGPIGKVEAFVPGPGRFWPEHLGAAPVPKVVLSPRNPKGPQESEIPVDPKLLAAGDHNGSTYYQHLNFNRAIQGLTTVEVSVEDGLKAVLIGLAAQESARTGRAMNISKNGLAFSPN